MGNDPYGNRRQQEEEEMMMMGGGGGVGAAGYGPQQQRMMMEEEDRRRTMMMMEEEDRRRMMMMEQQQRQQQGAENGSGRFNPRRRQEQRAVPGASYRRPITNLSFNSEMDAQQDPRMMMGGDSNDVINSGPYGDGDRRGNNFGPERRDARMSRDPLMNDDRRTIGDRWSPSSFRPNNNNNNNGYDTARLYDDMRLRRDPNADGINRWNPSTYRSGNAYNPSTASMRSPQENNMMPRSVPRQALYDDRRMGVGVDNNNKWSPSTFRSDGERQRMMMENDFRRGGGADGRWSPSWFQPDALGYSSSSSSSPTQGIGGERPLRPWNPRRSNTANFWGGGSSSSSSSSQYKTGVTEPISSKDFQKGISNQVTIGPESVTERRRRMQRERGARNYDPNDGPSMGYYDDPYYAPYGGVDGGEYGYLPQQGNMDNMMYPQQRQQPSVRPPAMRQY